LNTVRIPPGSAGAARLVPTPADLRPDLKTAWPWLFWVLWGAWLAVSDLRSDDMQAAVLRLVIGAAVLSCARPRHWVLWSLALALWVPAEPVLAFLMQTTPRFEPNAGVWLLPPLPALVGGLLGRGVARGVLTRRTS